MWYEMLIFIMSLVPQNVLDFVLDCCSGELDLGTLGSYSGSPFLTPDAFLRSPDKDVLGEDNDLWCFFASPFTIFSHGCLFEVLSAVRMYGCSFFLLCKSYSYCQPFFWYHTSSRMLVVSSPEDKNVHLQQTWIKQDDFSALCFSLQMMILTLEIWSEVNVLVLWLHKMPKSRHLFSWAKVLLRYSKRKIRAVMPFQHSHFWYLCLGRQCSSPRRAKSLSCSPKLMRNSVIYVGSCYLLVRKGYGTSGRTGTLLWRDSCTVWKRIIRILCWVIYTGNIVST